MTAALREACARRHCATCNCPALVIDLTVYPPNAIAYGTCGTCGQPFWEVECHDYRRQSRHPDYTPERTRHCGCCTHDHRKPGGYELAKRPRVIA